MNDTLTDLLEAVNLSVHNDLRDIILTTDNEMIMNEVDIQVIMKTAMNETLRSKYMP